MKQIGLLTGAAAALLFQGACQKISEQARDSSPPAPVRVQVRILALSRTSEVYVAPGTVRAEAFVPLSSKVPAYVHSVFVHEGDRIHAGQTLVTLSEADLSARVAAAQSAQERSLTGVIVAQSAVETAKTNLDLAQLTFKRLQQLYDKRSISDQEFDEGKAKVKGAQAALDGARAQQGEAQSRVSQAMAELRSAQIDREYATIKAPFSGIVVNKSVDPGVLALPGTTLLTVEKIGGYRLEASVEESRLPFIHVRDRVPVQLDALSRTVRATISDIVPMADTATRSYIVKLKLPSTEGLHSGMFGRALFSVGSREALLIPSESILSRGDLDSVLVAENQVARRRLVTLGTRSGSQQTVLSGLRPGDALIFPLPAGVGDGTPVEVSNER